LLVPKLQVNSAWKAGWTAGIGDKTFSALSVYGNPFDTTTFRPVSGLQNFLPETALTDFPTTDFYGDTRTTRVPGAVNFQ
jgi:hypothetical protein